MEMKWLSPRFYKRLPAPHWWLGLTLVSLLIVVINYVGPATNGVIVEANSDLSSPCNNNEHIEGDGEKIFAHACKLGLEGIVSKRWDMAYRSGRALTWIKVTNPKLPAAFRIEEGTF